MIKNKGGYPEGCVCEQFAYLPYSGIYPTSSDMNELVAVAKRRNKS